MKSILVITPLILLLIILHAPIRTQAQEIEEEDYNYDENSGKGPSEWGGICNTGEMQSPVDLTDVTVELLTAGSDEQVYKQYQPASTALLNRGHDVALEWRGDAGSIEIDGTQYQLQQLHWHIPSEHTINGKRYNLERHAVHVNAETNQTAVIAVLYIIGREDPLLSQLRSELLELVETNVNETEAGVIDPNNITYNDQSFYRYRGSLTTPPCTEGVTWTIQKKIRTVSRSQLNLLLEAVHGKMEQPQKMDEKERVDVGDLEVEELKGQPFEVVEEPNEGSYEVAEELNEGPHEVVEEVKSRLLEVEGVKQDAVSSFLGMSKEQDVVILGEPSIELTLGQQDIVKKEEIKFDSPRAVEECTDTKNNHGCFSGSDNGSKQLLQPCTFGVGKEAVKQLEMEGEDYTKEVDYMNAVEHIKEWEHMEEGEQMETDNVEEVEGDEMREQLEVNDEEDVEGNEMGEHFELEDEEELERDELEGQLEVEDEEEEEPNDEIECNIAPNYGPLEGADLTGDLLQGFETGQMPMNLQGQQLHESSSMEFFASNAETHLIMGGPSMYE